MRKTRSSVLVFEVNCPLQLTTVDVFTMRDATVLTKTNPETVEACGSFLDAIERQVRQYCGRFRCVIVLSGNTAHTLANAGAGPQIRTLHRSGCVQFAGGTDQRIAVAGVPESHLTSQIMSGKHAVEKLLGVKITLFGDVGAALTQQALEICTAAGYRDFLFRASNRFSMSPITDSRLNVRGIPVHDMLSERCTQVLRGPGIAGEAAQRLRDSSKLAPTVVHLTIDAPKAATTQLPKLVHAILADPDTRLFTSDEHLLRQPRVEGDIAPVIQPQILSRLPAAARRQVLALAPLLQFNQKNLPARLHPLETWHTLLARTFYDFEAPTGPVPARHICGSHVHDRYIQLATAIAALELRLRAVRPCQP